MPRPSALVSRAMYLCVSSRRRTPPCTDFSRDDGHRQETAAAPWLLDAVNPHQGAREVLFRTALPLLALMRRLLGVGVGILLGLSLSSGVPLMGSSIGVHLLSALGRRLLRRVIHVMGVSSASGAAVNGGSLSTDYRKDDDTSSYGSQNENADNEHDEPHRGRSLPVLDIAHCVVVRGRFVERRDSDRASMPTCSAVFRPPPGTYSPARSLVPHDPSASPEQWAATSRTSSQQHQRAPRPFRGSLLGTSPGTVI